MKNILGLDLGTNSIGWDLIQQDFKNIKGQIVDMGSRIIQMIDIKKPHRSKAKKSSAYSLIVICKAKVNKINKTQNNYE